LAKTGFNYFLRSSGVTCFSDLLPVLVSNFSALLGKLKVQNFYLVLSSNKKENKNTACGLIFYIEKKYANEYTTIHRAVIN